MARIVLTGATILCGSAEAFQGTCIIDDDRIAWVGPECEAEIDPTDLVYDLAGLFLMPGLISCHVHADLLKFGLAEFAAGERLGKERPPGYLMAAAVRTARLLVESGFTGYVGAACPHHIDAQLEMAIADGVVPGPRIRPCGHHVGTTADNNDTVKWWHDFRTPGTDVFADGVDALRALVRTEIRCGARIIKFYASSGQGIPNRHGVRNMSRDEMAAIVDAAHGRGVPVRAHVTQRDLILECLDLGVDVIDHGNEIDEVCIERMAKNGTFWVPSLLFSRVALDHGAGADSDYGRTLRNLAQMLPRADAAGVRILLGDDYGVDGMSHERGVYARELGVYAQETGIDPARILRWGTVNGGELLTGRPGEVGVVAAGALADLIVMSADPTADLTTLERPELHLVDVLRAGKFHFGRLAALPSARSVRSV